MVATYQSGGLLPQGLDFVQPGDMEAMAARIDFIGLNYYTREVCRAWGAPDNLPQVVFAAPPDQRTDMGWEVYPEGLYWLLNRVYFEYQAPKIYITENGCSYSDGPDATGRIRDQRRIDYLAAHLAATHRAIGNGVPVAGYFVWSLIDNFEWAHGFRQRFGLVWVDYTTQQRIPKDSAWWYRDVIAANALTLPD
jgi:beta-glucosidase